MNLKNFGWSEAMQNTFSALYHQQLYPARICREDRGLYTLVTEEAERQAKVSGNFRHTVISRSDFPAVGDWVAVEVPDAVSRCIIHGILPRFSQFSRKAPGSANEEQIVAANIDTAFLVSGLDHDFNSRRIERYLTLVYEAGVNPVILLNKVDLELDLASKIAETESIAYGVPVIAVSAKQGQGVEQIWEYLTPGSTGVLLGSSGVGKSSLINALLVQEKLKTSSVREADSKGRHTTTHRELVPLPNGAVLLDTPGMRELQLLASESALASSFVEISELARDCRFRDCTHTDEPGCAVKAGVEAGILDLERYESYLRQRKEIKHNRVEQDIHLQKQEVNRWKAIHRSLKQHHKYKK